MRKGITRRSGRFVEPLVDTPCVGNHINLIPGMFSPADIRHCKDILDDFGLPYVLLPDYSDTLDGPAWDEYQLIPDGGTLIDDIQRMSGSKATIEFGNVDGRCKTAGAYLLDRCSIPQYQLEYPIGVQETDRFFHTLETICGNKTLEKHRMERGRLIDAYTDAHKYIFEKRAISVWRRRSCRLNGWISIGDWNDSCVVRHWRK